MVLERWIGVAQRWLLGLGCLLVIWSQAAPAVAAIAPINRQPLTLTLLQERLQHPVQSDGVPTIDLRQLTIDLRPENGDFRGQFYRLLQEQLQRPGAVVGLDLSYSTIQGDWQLSLLGVRVPLYGQALSPLFTPSEQEQLQRDRRRLARLSTLSRSLLALPNGDSSTSPLQITVLRGPLTLNQTYFADRADFSKTFFLNRLEAQRSVYAQVADWSETRFSRTAQFAGTMFAQEASFRSSVFFHKAVFDQARFQGSIRFQGSEFDSTANFNRAEFRQAANFSRIQWLGNADFAQTHWYDVAEFLRSRFGMALFLTDAVFEQAVLFREVQFNRPVNLRGAAIAAQADFGYANFAKGAYLNVPGLKFDADRAKLIGDPGQIGRHLSVPTLQGNENLLRELVRNFRKLEQIPDANQLDYTRERLRLQELRQQLFGVNLNAASLAQLRRVGFSQPQATAIAQRRRQQLFHSPTEILAIAGVDLATYVNVRDRILAQTPLPPLLALFSRVGTGLSWVGLGLLLLLSRYGTNFWLIFGVGLVTIAYFGVLFWLLDRWRRRHPKPILPTLSETIWVLAAFSLLSVAGLMAIFRTSDTPWWTLASLGAIAVPLPTLLLGLLYQRGRYHALMDVSYFTEEGSLRQLRIMIGRLPIIPRFELFRERYMPLLWNRRWNWLNYFDFSLNNLLRFGFNDIRLRDQQLPGLITTLVWYQWTLGLLYIALLLWTLSRTIPGLNLLIYFK